MADEAGLASNFLYPSELSGGQEAARNLMTCVPFLQNWTDPATHVSRQLRLPCLGIIVRKRLTCGRESLAVGLMSLVETTAAPWPEQASKVFG